MELSRVQLASVKPVEAEGPKADWRAFWSDKHLKDLRLYDNYSSRKEPMNHNTLFPATSLLTSSMSWGLKMAENKGVHSPCRSKEFREF